MREHEIKVPVVALEPMRHRLRRQGATLCNSMTLEDNLILDDDAGTLRTAGRVLRVRNWGPRWTVTFKGPADFHGGIKSRPEVEAAVEDGPALLALLGELGFFPVCRYQKRRELWRYQGVLVALDETPMGCFVEVEGDAGHLPTVVADLGLMTSAGVEASYLELWDDYRRDHPAAPRDMVFP